MKNFMSQVKSNAEALQEAKIGMMKKENPFYCGAFVTVGKPTQ